MKTSSTSSPCAHDHLKFEDGTLHLTCIDCDAVWGGLIKKGGMQDYTLLGSVPLYPTRHNPIVTPRVGKVK